MRTHRWLVTLFAIVLGTTLYSRSGMAQSVIPSISSGGILNAASLGADPSNVAAPGGLITIFGKNLANSFESASTSPLPLNLNGTVVQIGNLFAPLLFVSATQINAQVPFEVAPGTVSVVVWLDGHPSQPQALQVQVAAPGIFTLSQIGAGPGKILHSDSTPVSSDSPAAPGEEVQILATGLGVTLGSASLPAVQTGLPGNGQPTLAGATITIGKSNASVTSSTAAQGAGQDVIKAVVPNVPAGDQPISISVSGITSRAPVTIAVGGPGQSIGGGGGGGGGGGTGVSGTGPLIFTGGILNAASLDPASNDTAAPGGLISIFGNNLALTTAAAGSPPLPLGLAGTSVLVGTVSAPLILVSPSQINAQVPVEIQPGTTVNVVVVVNGQASTPEPLKIMAAAPGVFSVAGNGAGAGNVFHADGTLVSTASPALPGEEVSVLATGLGATISTAILPAVTTAQAGNGQLTVVTPTVSMGGKDARVTSSVAAPGKVGQYLIRAVVPDIPAGDQDVVITAAGNASRAAGIRIGFLFAQPPAFLQANLAGNFTASFSLTVVNPSDPTFREVAVFSKTVSNNGCTIEIAGTNGPNYTGLVHCQDYSNPNNLIAVIVGLKNGQFADNKLVFTTILDTGINHFFYIGTGQAPSGPITLTADAPITAAAVSIDLKRPDFAPGDTIVGTLNVTLKIGESSTIPGQSVVLGGGFQDSILFVQR
jgi:uncharacterized protein (TIGR03437 family)